MSRTTVLAISTLCLFAASACDTEPDGLDRSEATNAAPDTTENENTNQTENEAENQTENQTQNAETCRLLSPGECAAAAGCRAISATRYEADSVCHHPAEQVGCMGAMQMCPSVLTYAKDPEGNTWRFQDGCIPVSWQSFQGGEADEAALGGSVCSAASAAPAFPPRVFCGVMERAISATRYEVGKRCRYPAKVVGCMDARLFCTLAFVDVKDTEGNTWQFRDGCLPVSWNSFPRVAYQNIAQWPLCL